MAAECINPSRNPEAVLFSPRTFQQPHSSLDTRDISGASPRRTYRRTRGWEGVNANYNEVDRGTMPKTLIQATTNRPNLYDNRDIEGSTARASTELRTPRVTNPLDPQYKLPSFATKPPTPPRGKARSSAYDVSDIQGTHPSPLYPFQQRDSMRTDDVEGANTQWKPLSRRYIGIGAPRSIDVRDINDEGLAANKVTHRHTNPLDPTYDYDVYQASMLTGGGAEGQEKTPREKVVGSIGMIDRSKPPGPMRPKVKGPLGINGTDFALNTDDIEGAKAGWKRSALDRPGGRRSHPVTNLVQDIDGAVTKNTKGHGPFSTRHTNPLNPDYNNIRGIRTKGEDMSAQGGDLAPAQPYSPRVLVSGSGGGGGDVLDAGGVGAGTSVEVMDRLTNRNEGGPPPDVAAEFVRVGTEQEAQRRQEGGPLHVPMDAEMDEHSGRPFGEHLQGTPANGALMTRRASNAGSNGGGGSGANSPPTHGRQTSKELGPAVPLLNIPKGGQVNGALPKSIQMGGATLANRHGGSHGGSGRNSPRSGRNSPRQRKSLSSSPRGGNSPMFGRRGSIGGGGGSGRNSPRNGRNSPRVRPPAILLDAPGAATARGGGAYDRHAPSSPRGGGGGGVSPRSRVHVAAPPPADVQAVRDLA